ncbi:MAG: PQQ-binding-like beta-propeller repeat protein [Verrucomicrobiales bacterium]|nr:PQQ-binding-like beta-propeller repeat protein [Verrucomicrobiales bacterium]
MKANFFPQIAILSVFSTILLMPSASKSDDWSVFRGPQSNGISLESDWVVPKSDAPILWKAEVGLGYSAATVADGKVYLTGHNGTDSDKVFCFDEASGDQIWVQTYPQPLGDLYFQGGTTGSVTVVGDRLFHIAREGEVFCRNTADGSVVWQISLQKDLDYKKPTWGFSGAPLPHKDRIYLTAGESGIALNQKDGSIIWKSDDEEAGYATPYLFEKNGRELLIFTNKRYYNCVDAGTGEKLWEVKWMTRYGVNAADPIVSGDHIFISSGYGKGATLLKWDGTGEPDTVWKSRDMRTQMNAAILIDGYLYAVDGNESADGTSLKCMDMLTGETQWSDTSIGHGTVSVAGGKLIVLTEMGELQIAPVSPKAYTPEFKQNVLKPRIWTVPVMANGRVYCRNAGGSLAVLDLRKP